MDWKTVIGKVAPTVATALGTPLAGAAVTAICDALGLKEATSDKIADVLRNGQLTPEQITSLRELEMKYLNDERERGFKYAELVYKDRDSARQYNTQGGIQGRLFVLSLILLVLTLGTEIAVLVKGFPDGVSELIVGRVLGLMDAIAMMVLTYYYGASQTPATSHPQAPKQ